MANILVVGGAGGVGSALVEALVARGDTVAATVLNEAEAKRVAEDHKGRVATHEIDMADADAALVALKAAVAAMPSLDAVAVCAAIAPIGPVELTPLATLRKTLEINTVAGVAVYQAALPALRKTGGRIVYITSMSGRMGMPFIGAYTGSKYGMEGLADVMRREAAPQGVKISLVEPGGIRTPMVDEQLATVMKLHDALRPEERERYGHLYRGFERLASESHRTTSSSAAQVAAVMIEALDAADPDPRYIAGDDAKQFLGMADSMSDREFDGFFTQIFAEQPVPAA
jgi:NAD(P)-dependent dehydrogenase (short-subunit alcohol dehydrogenase family)